MDSMGENESQGCEPDWSLIERAVRFGHEPMTTIAERYGVDIQALQGRAKRSCWSRAGRPVSDHPVSDHPVPGHSGLDRSVVNRSVLGHSALGRLAPSPGNLYSDQDTAITTDSLIDLSRARGLLTHLIHEVALCESTLKERVVMARELSVALGRVIALEHQVLTVGEAAGKEETHEDALESLA